MRKWRVQRHIRICVLQAEGLSNQLEIQATCFLKVMAAWTLSLHRPARSNPGVCLAFQCINSGTPSGQQKSFTCSNHTSILSSSTAQADFQTLPITLLPSGLSRNLFYGPVLLQQCRWKMQDYMPKKERHNCMEAKGYSLEDKTKNLLK